MSKEINFDTNNNKWTDVRLSNQAVATVMMALQKCILEQVDITDLLKDLSFSRDMDTNELVITNPPSIKFDDLGTD
tara:strand:+ start:5285 stop:5512 length:228 start_codon:yes stop_codon:yes gene_type:complete